MKTLILVLIFAWQATGSTRTVTPPMDVQEKVKPIIDQCEIAQASQGERQNAAFWQIAKLTGELSQTKTKTSDEALVVLMSFYLGESTNSDLLHEVTVRGKRMLPLLLKYRDATIIFSRKKYPSSLLLAPDIRKESFDDAIESIKAGEVIGVE